MNDTAKMLFKIALPIVIGIASVVWLFGKEFNAEVLSSIRIDSHTVACIALALLFFIGRDVGMAWRFRALTDRRLSWRKSVNVTMLCEFTSAVTPTSVGGSALSMIYLNREGIRLGHATAVTMTTLFLDELFFVIAGPVIFIALPYSDLFGFESGDTIDSLQTAFWVVYGVITAWTAILFLGIFVIPHKIKSLLVGVFRLPFIRRWQQHVVEMGDNLVETSRDIKGKPLKWWCEAFAATSLSWVSRYLVVNALFLAFAPYVDQIAVFGRQFVIWALLMFSPTPGGSGVSEWIFKEYYGDMMTDATTIMVIALTWRILTYYVYLLIGVCLLPSFFNKSKHKKHNNH